MNHSLSSLHPDRREALAHALAESDYDALRRLGWWEIVQLLQTGWAKKPAMPELVPWSMHAERDPADVAAAIHAHAAENGFPPGPMHLMRFLVRPPGDEPDRTSPSLRPAVLAAVREALAQGMAECQCAEHWSTWSRRVAAGPGSHVAVCRECGGLEPGQVTEATRELEAA